MKSKQVTTKLHSCSWECFVIWGRGTTQGCFVVSFWGFLAYNNSGFISNFMLRGHYLWCLGDLQCWETNQGPLACKESAQPSDLFHLYSSCFYRAKLTLNLGPISIFYLTFVHSRGKKVTRNKINIQSTELNSPLKIIHQNKTPQFYSVQAL